MPMPFPTPAAMRPATNVPWPSASTPAEPPTKLRESRIFPASSGWVRVDAGVDYGDRDLLESRKGEPRLVEAALRQVPLAGDERIGRGESKATRPQRLDVADAFDPGERRALPGDRPRERESGRRSSGRDPVLRSMAVATLGHPRRAASRPRHGRHRRRRATRAPFRPRQRGEGPAASCPYPTTARTAVTPSAYPPVAGRRARYSPGWRTSVRNAPAESTVLLATRLHVEPARRSMKTAAPESRGRTVPASVFGSTESRDSCTRGATSTRTAGDDAPSTSIRYRSVRSGFTTSEATPLVSRWKGPTSVQRDPSGDAPIFGGAGSGRCRSSRSGDPKTTASRG